ncbi:MAG: hypothetical protein GVY04_23395 [Cyanobacteria bacterium]|nr:hypothetical protein [Cyanobacteria bacterium GSL.Bin1]
MLFFLSFNISGFKQSKSELGWADYRVTDYSYIEKWWQLVMSAYLMISLHSEILNPLVSPVEEKFQNHDWWDEEKGWKSAPPASQVSSA